MSERWEAEYIEKYPKIDWRKPITINRRYLACRLCIARYGLKTSELELLCPTTISAFRMHLWKAHQLKAQ
jgi:hypothetical protein